MNDMLDIARLGLLLKNHLLENKKRYLLYLGGVFLIGFIIFLFSIIFGHYNANYYLQNDLAEGKTIYSTEWEYVQTGIYYIGLLLFGGIFACISFVNFSNKAEAIFYMNKPASILEKWLAEMVIRTLLFFVAYTIVFYLLDIPFTLVVRSIEFADHRQNMLSLHDQYVSKIFQPSHSFNFTLESMHFMHYCLCISIYLSVVGFFMYGSVLFNQFSFFKSLFLAFGIWVFYYFYTEFFINTDILLPNDWNYNFPIRATLYDQNGDKGLLYETTLPEYINEGVAYFLMLLVPFTFYICSYLKLKEKEV